MNIFKNKKAPMAILLIGSILLFILAILLYSPVTITSDGNYSSLVTSSLKAAFLLEQENGGVTIPCIDGQCDLVSSQDGLSEGDYKGRIEVRNILGMLLKHYDVTFTIDNSPPELSLSYPRLTNKPMVSVDIDSEIGAKIYLGDQLLGIFTEQGIKYDWALSGKGINELIFASVDVAGNRVETTASVQLDKQVGLTISSPKNKSTVGNTFTISGKTDSGAVVSANGSRTKAKKDGSFKLTVAYKSKTIIVRSTDLAGNTVTKQLALKLKVISASGASSSSTGSSATCSRYSTIQNQISSKGSAAVIIGVDSIANRQSVLDKLNGSDMKIGYVYSSIPYFSGTLYQSGLNKLCTNSSITSITLDGVVFAS